MWRGLRLGRRPLRNAGLNNRFARIAPRRDHSRRRCRHRPQAIAKRVRQRRTRRAPVAAQTSRLRRARTGSIAARVRARAQVIPATAARPATQQPHRPVKCGSSRVGRPRRGFRGTSAFWRSAWLSSSLYSPSVDAGCVHELTADTFLPAGALAARAAVSRRERIATRLNNEIQT
jgi:hypothetical protein